MTTRGRSRSLLESLAPKPYTLRHPTPDQADRGRAWNQQNPQQQQQGPHYEYLPFYGPTPRKQRRLV